MGFYIRKSVKVGPLRFNLSKSGVGVSAGIKGLRFGTGPRGNYVHMGRGGLYFRRSLNTPAAGARPATLPVPPATDTEPLGSVGPMEEIESGSVLEMADASSADLVQELNEKRQLPRQLPLVVTLSIAALLVALAAGAPPWAVALIGLLAVPTALWVSTLDTLRRTTVILFDLAPDVVAAYDGLHEAFSDLRHCARTWHVEAQAGVRDRKYQAGADAVVRRQPVTLTTGNPPLVRTNVEVPLLPVGRQTLAFMPDRLLVFDATGVGAVAYPDLSLEVSDTDFIEEGPLPGDAVVIRKTWRYVNKKGGPDRRFKDNPELPICAYEELRLTSESGLNEVVQLSRRGVGAALSLAIQAIDASSRGDEQPPAPA